MGTISTFGIVVHENREKALERVLLRVDRVVHENEIRRERRDDLGSHREIGQFPYALFHAMKSSKTSFPWTPRRRAVCETPKRIGARRLDLAHDVDVAASGVEIIVVRNRSRRSSAFSS